MPTPEMFASVINSYLPEPQASLLNGIIFGIPINSRGGFYQELKMVGLLHMVVLSGTNITILGAVIGSALGCFSKRLVILITIPTVIIFILFVGPQAPIIRAGFMGLLTLVSILLGRKSTAVYALLLSSVFILVFWPGWIKTISFQLSYGATLGMILFSGGIRSRPEDADSWLEKLIDYSKKDIRTSLAAQIFTAPLIFIYFRQISLISPLANLLVSFTIGPLMILGFATAVLGKINYSLGLLPAYLSYGILTYMVFIIKTLAKIPFAYFNF